MVGPDLCGNEHECPGSMPLPLVIKYSNLKNRLLALPQTACFLDHKHHVLFTCLSETLKGKARETAASQHKSITRVSQKEQRS